MITDTPRQGRSGVAIIAAGLLEAVVGGDGEPAVQWVQPSHGYRDAIGATFDPCSSIADAVVAVVDRGATPLVVAGNCMASLSVLAGLRSDAGEIGIVWLDAHADFNTPESSVSGYLDGMALSSVAGHCWTVSLGGSRVSGRRRGIGWSWSVPGRSTSPSIISSPWRAYSESKPRATSPMTSDQTWTKTSAGWPSTSEPPTSTWTWTSSIRISLRQPTSSPLRAA